MIPVAVKCPSRCSSGIRISYYVICREGSCSERIYTNSNRGKKCTIYWEVPRSTTTVTEDTFKKLRSLKSAEDVLLT